MKYEEIRRTLPWLRFAHATPQAFQELRLGTSVSLICAKPLSFSLLLISVSSNAFFMAGYYNATWTLRVELVNEKICTLFAHMKRHGLTSVVATRPEGLSEMEPTEVIGMKSGYLMRACNNQPKTGSSQPWQVFKANPAELCEFWRSSAAGVDLNFK